MSPKKTKKTTNKNYQKNVQFQENWLTKKDSLGYVVKKYLKKDEKDVHKAFCFICEKEFSVKKGFEKIEQHIRTGVHQQNLPKIDNTQLILNVVKNTNTNENSNNNNAECSQKNTVISLAHRNTDAIKAEVFWCFHLINSKSSNNSCKDIGNLFKKMFSDSKIAEDFSLGPIKAKYYMTDALSPYYKKNLKKNYQEYFIHYSMMKQRIRKTKKNSK